MSSQKDSVRRAELHQAWKEGIGGTYSPGADWSLDIRLMRGTLKEQELEAARQGLVECWETKVRRDREGSRRHE